MKIVIDTNKIMASLIRDGLSRALIFSDSFQFFTPEQALVEIEKHEKELCLKANLTVYNFKLLLSFLFERINIVPKGEYEKFLEESLKLLSDKDDAPFLALAFALSADGIWTDDGGFMEQNKVSIFTTKYMLDDVNK